VIPRARPVLVLAITAALVWLSGVPQPGATGAGVGAQPATSPVSVGSVAAASMSSARMATVPVPSARRGGVIRRDLFGMHLLHTRTSWPSVPVTHLRLWDTQTTWNRLQPTRTRWDWRRLDETVANARRNGARVTMTLGQTPTWASSRPRQRGAYGLGAAAPPRSMADWRAYVRAVATRYRGSIEAYEIWNEPNWTEYWTGSSAQLAALTREASRVIRAVDPKALVVTPSWVPVDGLNDRRMQQYFAAGAGRYIDAVAVHLYATTPEASLQFLARVRRSMATQGYGRLPVWNTEITYGRRKRGERYSAAKSVGIVARTFLLAPYSTQRRIYWYAWDDWDFGSTELWSRSTGRPTPAARAYREVYDWMVGSRDQGCAVSRQVWSCAFALRTGGRGLAVWSVGAATTRRVPSGYHRIRYLDGRVTRTAPGRSVRLTGSPVLLTTR
jgi:hypothetical protein